ncbi:MAG TPA: hypothetical protein VGW10_04305 [Solirubrobacteraceae bacterium]|nr:hypothetical protein [Solirubrobacteraceae bacterium]
MKRLNRLSSVGRAFVVAIPMAALGYLFAVLGAGVAGFVIAGALTSPSIVWILDAHPDRPLARRPPR